LSRCGAPVHERLPDDVLLSADEIELVDMSPHALRQRMKHGNVYPPERAGVALARFFTEANLTALRELSLRLVARRVAGQLETAAAGDVPLVTERVVVLLESGPACARAIRRAATLAGHLNAALVAVVIDPPGGERRSFDQRRDLQEAIDDAADLGADLVRVEARDVVEGVERVVRSRRATHVVLPQRQPGGLSRLLERPLADRLLERLPDVEVHLVAASPAVGAG
jgi:two-component system sensor histidine kinase KdpD